MKYIAYCMFETPLGPCGIAWRKRGDQSAVALFQLPEATPEMTEARIAQGSGAREATTPPPEIGEVINRVRKHLRGEIQDFRDAAVDLDGAGLFVRRVYEATREIPAGQTRTYGELSNALGRPAAARAVGQALARNPIPLIIPCHRVLAAGGRPGGFSAHGGRATKATLLAIEGASLSGRRGQLSLIPSLVIPIE